MFANWVVIISHMFTQGRFIVVDNIRVRAVGRSSAARRRASPAAASRDAQSAATPEPLTSAVGTATPAAGEVEARTQSLLDAAPRYSVFFEGGRVDTPFVQLQQLPRGASVAGPAVIVGTDSRHNRSVLWFFFLSDSLCLLSDRDRCS